MIRAIILAFSLISTVTLAAPPPIQAPAPVSEREAMVDWAMERIVAWAPPGHASGRTYPDAIESPEDAAIRYRSIASDAVAVVYDASATPMFPGPEGRARTLALLLSTAFNESGFRRDVDYGLGAHSKGDSGRSWCLNQVQLGKAGPDGRTSTRIVLDGPRHRFSFDGGLGGEDLVRDRQNCFRVAVSIMRSSFNQCQRLPMEERLSVYTSGDCRRGRASSRARVGMAMFWMWRHAPPFQDAIVMRSLSDRSPIAAPGESRDSGS